MTAGQLATGPPPEFERAADAISQLVRALDEQVMTLGPPWPAGSRVASEVVDDPLFAGRWGTRPVQDATMSGLLALHIAEDHLIGIAALILAPDTVFTPLTLSRTVLAASARSYWVLDPAIAGRERLRRAMNVQLQSYRERSGLLDDGPSEDRDRLARLTLQIVQTAPKHGFVMGKGRPGRSRLWPERWLDERIPSEMQMVEQLLRAEGEAGIGNLAYRSASAIVHAQPHGVGMLTIEASGPSVNGVSPGRIGISIATLTRYLAAAVFGVHLAGRRAVNHAGQSIADWDRAVQPALQTWAELMRVEH